MQASLKEHEMNAEDIMDVVLAEEPMGANRGVDS